MISSSYKTGYVEWFFAIVIPECVEGTLMEANIGYLIGCVVIVHRIGSLEIILLWKMTCFSSLLFSKPTWVPVGTPTTPFKIEISQWIPIQNLGVKIEIMFSIDFDLFLWLLAWFDGILLLCMMDHLILRLMRRYLVDFGWFVPIGFYDFYHSKPFQFILLNLCKYPH